MGGTNDKSLASFFRSPEQAIQSLGNAVSLRDYRHASKLFRDGANRLAPKYGFMYHVAFDFDANAPFAQTEPAAKIEAGLLVKEMTLPSFDIIKKVGNAYNRKTIIQSKVEYQDVDIIFHDDSANITNTLWTAYFRYYYGDSGRPEESYHLATKYQSRSRQDWGFMAPATPFFKSIRLYSISQHKYTVYVLVNPIITGWRHGTHASTSEGFMENRMSVTYENVLYGHGVITDESEEPKYFTDMHYDPLPSPLGKDNGAGTPASIFGAGGAINTIQNVFGNLADGNVLGAVGSVVNGYKNFSNIKATLKDTAWNIGRDVMRGDPVGDNFYFDNPFNSIMTVGQRGIQGIATGVTTMIGSASSSSAATSNNKQISVPSVMSDSASLSQSLTTRDATVVHSDSAGLSAAIAERDAVTQPDSASLSNDNIAHKKPYVGI